MERVLWVLSLVLSLNGIVFGAGPKFAPYYDVTLGRPNLVETAARTGQKDYTLAFALAGAEGCVPSWGAQFPIDDETILRPIREVIQSGGQMIVATGGALGNYLEHRCPTVETLTAAYIRALDAVGSTHLDVDIEAPVNLDVMNGALALLQRQRPEVTVSFTLMVQGDDYGVTPSLGYDVLVSAKRLGVNVGIVNIMAMEFPSTIPSWGDAVIASAVSTLRQMGEIWPEKSPEELRSMLGVTPMLGRNFNGKVFELNHGRQLASWATEQRIGFLSFWSIGRDNGGCLGTISPTCSGIPQGDFEFTSIFRTFSA